MFRPGSSFRESLRLSWRAFCHDWRQSACLILTLASILTPLLVLLGLKSGLMDVLVQRLVEQPSIREIKLVGSSRLDDEWFASLSARDGVAYLAPRTRAIAATITLRNPDRRAGPLAVAELVPSGPGDPLLAPSDPTPRDILDVVLSAPAAEILGVGMDDPVEGIASRSVGGVRQSARTRLRVLAVLSASAFQRNAVFATPALLAAIEDYRDGRAVPALEWPGSAAATKTRLYAGFRLYADTIYDVPHLRDVLHAQGLEVRTSAAQIEAVVNLDRNLTIIFGIIVAIAASGYILSLASSVWSEVERRRREFGLLRLVGFPGSVVVLFPVWQAVMISLVGFAIASAAYLVIEASINVFFSSSLDEAEVVCQLAPWHYPAVFVSTLLVAVFAASFGGYRAAQIEPAEGMADV